MKWRCAKTDPPDTFRVVQLRYGSLNQKIEPAIASKFNGPSGPVWVTEERLIAEPIDWCEAQDWEVLPAEEKLKYADKKPVLRRYDSLSVISADGIESGWHDVFSSLGECINRCQLDIDKKRKSNESNNCE